MGSMAYILMANDSSIAVFTDLAVAESRLRELRGYEATHNTIRKPWRSVVYYHLQEVPVNPVKVEPIGGW